MIFIFLVGNSELICYFNNFEVVLKMYNAKEFNIHDYVWISCRAILREKNKIVFVPKIFKGIKKLLFVL
jgi:hypothetical protein